MKVIDRLLKLIILLLQSMRLNGRSAFFSVSLANKVTFFLCFFSDVPNCKPRFVQGRLPTDLFRSQQKDLDWLGEKYFTQLDAPNHITARLSESDFTVSYHVSCKNRQASPYRHNILKIERIKNDVKHVCDSLSEHVENHDGLQKMNSQTVSV